MTIFSSNGPDDMTRYCDAYWNTRILSGHATHFYAVLRAHSCGQHQQYDHSWPKLNHFVSRVRTFKPARRQPKILEQVLQIVTSTFLFLVLFVFLLLLILLLVFLLLLLLVLSQRFLPLIAEGVLELLPGSPIQLIA
jgi:hypothetical protein